MSHEMAASLRPSSPAAEPLEIEDLLEKILLRLPPLPSSLPRASAVCSRWLGLVSDPRFVRRFRAHHRHNPPLLGYFSHYRSYLFQSTLEAPNRVPEGRFIFPAGDIWPLGCRHGLMLILHSSHTHLLVWDPITGDQYRLDIPPGYDAETSLNGTVLRASGEDHHFQVVLVGNSDIQYSQLVASVYSSETGVWGNLITKPHPPDDPTHANFEFAGIYHGMSSVMVGDSLYWLFSRNISPAIIVEFDLARESLALIPGPVDEAASDSNMWVVPTEGGGLGFLFLASFCAQFWKRKKDCDGVTSWVLGRSIQLDNLLSLNPKTEHPRIVGFAEENNIVFLGTNNSIFTVQLDSLQFKKLSVPDEGWFLFYPYEVVYTADKGIDGGLDGVELLQNT